MNDRHAACARARRGARPHRSPAVVDTAAGALDINTAARDDLMRIPGIGEHYANAIIEHRPYGTVEDLLRVPGIGEKRLARLREWVTVAR
jgi:competence ComEA-like helix-hairpin-helix protein